MFIVIFLRLTKMSCIFSTFSTFLNIHIYHAYTISTLVRICDTHIYIIYIYTLHYSHAKRYGQMDGILYEKKKSESQYI